MTTGWIHSYETGGTADGPGVRFVLFLSGCPLRCRYCHNPDGWRMKSGRRVDSAEVNTMLDKYVPFLKRAGGGLTISGGEPLNQAEFCRDVFRHARSRGLHTALDTCGYLGAQADDDLLDLIDLVLLDIKSMKPDLYEKVTGVELDPTLRFARRLADRNQPAWVRFVLVPGLTDDRENIDQLGSFVAQLPNVQRLEVLPFHQLGAYKWTELGLEYLLEDTPPASPEEAETAREALRTHGLTVV
jgi:pyruvate formate lyase activating enzyme